jgi:hypothetical protein
MNPHGIDALGLTGKDVITEYEGIITGFCAYLTGCHQYLLTAKRGTDGRIPEGKWVDVDRVKIDTFWARVELPNTANGGDLEPPVR